MSTAALAVVPQTTREVNYNPHTFEEALIFAKHIAESNLVPKEYMGKPANVLVAMLHGKELGLSPLQSLQSIATINGRPGIFGDAQLAIVQNHPAYEWHKEWLVGEGDAMTAHFQIKRKGMDLHEETFSVADAKRAGLWDDRPKINRREGQGQMDNPSPWYCYPKRMMKFRARSFGLRDTFADALKGLKSLEEIADYPIIEGERIDRPTQQSAKVEEDGPIGSILASEWSGACRAAGLTTAVVRAYLKEAFGVETSLEIKRSQIDKAWAWLRQQKPSEPATTEPAKVATKESAEPVKEESKREAKPEPTAETKSTEVVPDDLAGNIAGAFAALGYDPMEESALREQFKDDAKGLFAHLSRVADEGSAS